MSSLREQQDALVRALVARGPAPAGLDPAALDASIRALLRKRAGEVAWHWPALMSDATTRARFVDWADGRPRTSSFADGLAFAEHLRSADLLPPAAQAEVKRHRRSRRRRIGRRR